MYAFDDSKATGLIEFHSFNAVIRDRVELAPRDIPHAELVLGLSRFSDSDQEFSNLVVECPFDTKRIA